MPKLELNMGFNVKIAGEFHGNGASKTVAKITQVSDEKEFARNVDILQEMVDLWNAKNATE